MAWTEPQYRRGEIDRAGQFLVNSSGRIQDVAAHGAEGELDAVIEQLEQAFGVINNWRSSHSYPLQVIKMTLLTRAKRLDKQAIIAQRLKRLASISLKLRRNENMKLSQMHDLGGCRAVLGTPRRVSELVEICEKAAIKNPNDRPELVKKYDYIANPKPDGYRSVHLVYKYQTKAENKLMYNGLRIEVQLRSRLQHAWATAVETVSSFTGQALKSNVDALDDEGWRRFFTLMGSAIAHREGSPAVPGMPKGAELKEELTHCEQKLDVKNRLRLFGAALRVLPQPAASPDAYYFLLELDLISPRITIHDYKESELERANADYLAIEKASAEKPGMAKDAVLVSVDSIANLQRAYPNYFLDTGLFVDAVQKAIA
jgi:ppGpp synthetase/RelA/SpoT-type nucleotidyltranferase